MTDIVFESYTGPDSYDATVKASLPLRSVGYDSGGGWGSALLSLEGYGEGLAAASDGQLTTAYVLATRGGDLGDGFGAARFPLTVDAVGDGIDGPSVSVGTVNLPVFLTVGSGFTTQDGQVSAHFDLDTRGTDAPALGLASLNFQSYGSDGIFPLHKSAFLIQQPMMGAHAFQGLIGQAHSTVQVGDSSLTFLATWVLRTLIGVKAVPGVSIELMRRIEDTIGLHDFVSAVLAVRSADGFLLSGTPGHAELRLLALVDHIALTCGASSTAESTRALALVFALADHVDTPEIGVMLSTLAFSDALAVDVEAYAHAIDAIRLADTLGETLLLTLVLADRIAVSDDGNRLLELVRALADAIGVCATLTLGDEPYTAWVMGMDSKAVWTYDDYPFNSFATVGGKRLACGPDGLSELGGDTDDGQPIAWVLQTGLTNLGTMFKKRLDCAYLGYASAGVVTMSVITTAPDGAKVQYNYTLDPIPSDVPVTNRIKLGRGLESVYYAFRYAGTGPISLDNARILKLDMSRRV